MSEQNIESKTGIPTNQQPNIGEATAPEIGEKTFTQSQLDGILRERLAKERERATADIAQRETELTKREFTYQAKELLMSKKIPLEVLAALNAPDFDTLNASIALLETHFNINNPNKLLDLPPVGSTEISKDLPIRQAMGLTNT